ncbi:hypothetical protein CR513_23792, partial [Mucuna pruriens]
MALEVTVPACFSISLWRLSLMAPRNLSTSLPSFKNKKVGIASMSVPLPSKRLKETNIKSIILIAISARTGAIKRHGPHQVSNKNQRDIAENENIKRGTREVIEENRRNSDERDNDLQPTTSDFTGIDNLGGKRTRKIPPELRGYKYSFPMFCVAKQYL